MLLHLPCVMLVSAVFSSTGIGESPRLKREFFKSFGEERALKGHLIKRSYVSSLAECGLHCLAVEPRCKSFNYIKSLGEDMAVCEINNAAKLHARSEDFVQHLQAEYFESLTDEDGPVNEEETGEGSLGVGGTIEFAEKNTSKGKQILKWTEAEVVYGGPFRIDVFGEKNTSFSERTEESQSQPTATSPTVKSKKKTTGTNGSFVDGSWSLVARFSNQDSNHWLKNHNAWWYDRKKSYGETLNPGHNGDMISEGFWLTNGSEFRITRSDDPAHTTLLTTTGNCLDGKTFRAKMKTYNTRSYATSRRSFKGSWMKKNCRGRCTASYALEHRSSESASLSYSENEVGFFCTHRSWKYEAFIMIEGNSSCNAHSACHGIGITVPGRTKSNSRANGNGDNRDRNDFLNYGNPSTSYSLNLWVRGDN